MTKGSFLFLSHSLSFSVQLGSFLSLKATRSSTTTTFNLCLSHRERYCV
ncbi:hypothetical protein GLYMA_04G146050v4 [Glycine max]|nr:hypothetical protein GLYMA_04G146050v4 [Glycine max]KAH1111376.1 hypothetical protein GYH30_009949 [Glycine max]